MFSPLYSISSLSLSSRLRHIQEGALSVHCPYRRLLLLFELPDAALGLLELRAGLLVLLFHSGQLPLDQIILLCLLGSRHLTLTRPIGDNRRGEASS